jgi:FkbM family methyltransferase
MKGSSEPFFLTQSFVARDFICIHNSILLDCSLKMIYNTQIAKIHFALSGEDRLLHTLANTKAKVETIFDVGSNQGEWTRMARQMFPTANIHAFEIIPEVYKKFINNGVIDSHVMPNNFGLGAETGTIQMKYCPDNDVYSTYLTRMSPGAITDMFFEWRECLIATGDLYVRMNNVQEIDILKIDVEGAEHLVIEGFNGFMKTEKIGLIQFEYGLANIVSKWLLVDAYELLSPMGYILGKLGPGGVNFKNYDLLDENFIGPNIVAVHQTRQDLLTALKFTV